MGYNSGRIGPTMEGQLTHNEKVKTWKPNYVLEINLDQQLFLSLAFETFLISNHIFVFALVFEYFCANFDLFCPGY